MIIRIIEDSLINMATFSGLALTNISEFFEVIEAAPNVQKLKSVLPDDVVIDNDGFVIIIKDNYQNAVGCIRAIVDENDEATISFQAYE